MSALSTLAPGTGTVRIRSTLRQWLWLLVAVVGAIAVTQAGLTFAWGNSAGSTGQAFVSVVTFAVVWAVMTALIFRWQGVTLAPDALHVHSLQSRTIRWPDIASLSTDRMLGITYVIVQESSGRRTRLRAPTTGRLAWDRDFEAKYQTIIAWHQALRGSADPS